MLTKKIKIILKKMRNVFKMRSIPKHFKSLRDVDFSPIFIIGTNRSGTSLTSYLLSQHPDLEGLYSGDLKPSFGSNTSHVLGYCESYHIWDWLCDPGSDFFEATKVDSPLWGHPQFLSQHYRNAPRNQNEALALVNSVQKHRKSNLRPLIKDQFNILRIGLIKKIFPHAKLVFVFREYDDYIPSCSHKWSSSLSQGIDSSVDLHWYTANSIAYFELNKHFKDSFSIVNFNELSASKENANIVLKRLLKVLNLKDTDFDCSIINPKFKHEKQVYTDNKSSFHPSVVDDLLEYQKKYHEKSIISDAQKTTGS